jgi:uncharacterized protein YaaN involved in tellurite resistance
MAALYDVPQEIECSLDEVSKYVRELEEVNADLRAVLAEKEEELESLEQKIQDGEALVKGLVQEMQDSVEGDT